MASFFIWINVLFVGVLALQAFSESIITSNYYSIIPENLTVSELGKYQVINEPIILEKGELNAPEPLLIVSPKEAGVYPILYFIHGTLISNQDYTQLFHHIASHGFIVVAPKLFSTILFFPIHLPTQQEEIDMAASVANWIPSNLQNILQQKISKQVLPNLHKLAISGHSRGGKTAFAVALGLTQKTKLIANFSALIGVDPVAGQSKQRRYEPHVLTYEPNSIQLSIPIAIIGTGLGNATRLFPFPCAPNGVNYEEFFIESKEASKFVIMEFGHMQLLNDVVDDLVPNLMFLLCAPGKRPSSVMRTRLGEIMVAFLNAYFRGQDGQYLDLMENPNLAPTKLFVAKKGNLAVSGYGQQIKVD